MDARVTAVELRAAIARSGIPAYVIGGRARIHPTHLSRLLRGREFVSQTVAARILAALEIEQEAGDAAR